jgi:hypothetical protein
MLEIADGGDSMSPFQKGFGKALDGVKTNISTLVRTARLAAGR